MALPSNTKLTCSTTCRHNLQRYAEWCTANNYPDYSVNKTIKLRAFMDFEISRRGNVPATTKSNLLRNLVPMLER